MGERQFEELGPIFERSAEALADVPCQVVQLRRPQWAVRVGVQRQAGVRPAASHVLDIGEEGVEGLLRQEGGGYEGHIFADGIHEFGVVLGLLLLHLLQQLGVFLHVGIAVRPSGDSCFGLFGGFRDLGRYGLCGFFGRGLHGLFGRLNLFDGFGPLDCFWLFGFPELFDFGGLLDRFGFYCH